MFEMCVKTCLKYVRQQPRPKNLFQISTSHHKNKHQKNQKKTSQATQDIQIFQREITKFRNSYSTISFEVLAWLAQQLMQAFPTTTWQDFTHSLSDIRSFFPEAQPADIAISLRVLGEINQNEQNSLRSAAQDLIVIQGATKQDQLLRDLTIKLAQLYGQMKVTGFLIFLIFFERFFAVCIFTFYVKILTGNVSVQTLPKLAQISTRKNSHRRLRLLGRHHPYNLSTLKILPTI